MPRKPPLSIRSRLILSFGAILALLIGVSGMTVFRMQQVAVALERISAEHLENLALITEIGENAEDAARKLVVLMSASHDERVLVYVEIAAADRLLDSAMTVLDTRLPDAPRRALLAQFGVKLKAYRSQYASNAQLIEAEDWQAARRMVVEQTEPALSELVSARDALARFEGAATTAETQGVRARYEQDKQVVIWLCAAGLAIGGLLALLVTRGIVQPLRRAEIAARRLIAGDYSQCLEITTDDEVGRVSSALNTLAVAVRDREDQLVHLSHTDTLTGLGQRARLVTQGDALIVDAARGRDTRFALLCIDIDRLKCINAVLGFDAGDRAIVEAADRIVGFVGHHGVAGRLAGGTFAVLLKLEGERAAGDAAAQLQTEIERKVIWKGQPLDLSTTIGISLWPEHARDCESLLRRAEQAMFEAKRQRTRLQNYTSSIEAARLVHLTLLSDLANAIEQGQLRMFVQPKVSPVDGRLHGVEALVRWKHPERGWLSPAEFIPFAEATGRIRLVTRWMLEKAVDTLAEWQSAGAQTAIAVNVSALDLQDELPSWLSRKLRDAGVAAHSLQIELTESGLMSSGPEPVAVLHALRDIGVRLAIDDFGTGQSSLAYLQRLPVHELKIDRSFVDGCDRDAQRHDLLRSIIGLGHGMGLVVTAEGVERPEELASLKNLGCDLIQGFLIARPVDVADFDIAAWRSPTAPLTPTVRPSWEAVSV